MFALALKAPARLTVLACAVTASLSAEAATVCRVQSGRVVFPRDPTSDGGYRPEVIAVPMLPGTVSANTVIWSTRRPTYGIGAVWSPISSAVGIEPVVDGGMLTDLRFVRGSPDELVTAQWYAAEFCSGVRAERGRLSVSPTSVALHASMDPAKSYGTTTASAFGGEYDLDDFFRIRPLDATSLEITNNDGANLNSPAEWQIFEHDGMTVERGLGGWNDGGRTELHPLAMGSDPATSFARVTWRIESYCCARDWTLTAQLVGDAGVRVSRVNGNQDAQYVWEVVRFTDGTRVLTGRATVAPSTGLTTVTLSPGVDLGRAVAFLGGAETWGSTNANTTDPSNALVTATLTSSTQLALERNPTNDRADVDWVVIEFAGTGTGFDAGSGGDGGFGPGSDAGGGGTDDGGRRPCLDSLPTADGGCVVPRLDPYRVGCACGAGAGASWAWGLLALLGCCGVRRKRETR